MCTKAVSVVVVVVAVVVVFMAAVCIAARTKNRNETKESLAVREQRDTCFDKYKHLWETSDGKSFHGFPDRVKCAMATAMSLAPALWSIEVRMLPL